MTTLAPPTPAEPLAGSLAEPLSDPLQDLPPAPGSRRAASPALARDVERFETMLARYLAGDLDEDSFRIFRLNNGIYGQRQGGHNQMVRVKLPYGSVSPEQLEALAHVAETYSRGWGHITTRQNVQFHFVQLEQVPAMLWDMAAVGLTTREACGDTVRNVTACHLAGACPFEALDVSPWAEAAFQHFLRHPYAQRLPRKVKINFSGCATDCGQAMFNDIGVVGVTRPSGDGTIEAGFRVFVAGGLGANPHPAQALEDFTPRELLIPTLEAVLRTFDHYGNRDNKIRARMKWLVDTLGIDELRERVLRERKLLIASVTFVDGIPPIVEDLGDAPAGGGTVGGGLPGPALPAPGAALRAPGEPGGAGSGSGAGSFAAEDPPVVHVALSGRREVPRGGAYERWLASNVIRGVANGTVSAIARARLGDLTAEQFRGVAAIQRSLGCEVRTTNRQNLVLRGLSEEDLAPLYERLAGIDMAEPGAELARDVVSCPGADTCNLAVTQSRGLAVDIDAALEQAGLADVDGVRVNISGCTNSCGQHHTADIGFFGAERRAHGLSAPGYQMLLGGHLGGSEVVFGAKALRLPARRVGEATVHVVGRYAEERERGESFASWLERVGGAAKVAVELKRLDEFPSPEEAPEFYVDFDEQAPFSGEVGIGECAGA